MKSRPSGFTLVELLVAVGIIGVLASVSVVSVNSVRAKGRDAKRISAVKQLQSALEGYFTTTQTYPVQGTLQAPIILGTAGRDTLCSDNTGFTQAGCASPYMRTVHRDPLFGALVPGVNGAVYDYRYHATTGAGGDCGAPGPCASYAIRFYFENGTGSFRGRTLTTASPNGIIQ